MGRRRPAVVLSSSSTDENCGGGVGFSAPAARRARTMTEPTLKKKRRRRSGLKSAVTVCYERCRSSYREFEAVKFDMLADEFCECLNDIHKASSSQIQEQKSLWVDKHKPQCLEELAVHKKKADEVKFWMESIMKTPKEKLGGNSVLLMTGPAGVGKSIVVDLIASQLGVELCEWVTPTPTLWQEHIHSGNLGLRYMSKLDEFECFVEKVKKYSLLRPPYVRVSRKPVILVIDDLPLANGRAAFVRLNKCLTSLVHWAQLPTIILMTEYLKVESDDRSTNLWEELETSLIRSGASKISFNPITQNAIKKTLSRISQLEKLHISSDLIDQIARFSCGDIRHAISTLQYNCLRPDTCLSPHASPLMLSTSLPLQSDTNSGVSFSFGKDESVALFHALGKFLHNKRKIADEPATGTGPVLNARYTRRPLTMDSPEKILSQAHCQPRPLVDFLHENVLDFINDEAIDDAGLIASYLSDSDCLLAVLHANSRNTSDKNELDGIAQSVAASVAIRGVLFGNSHPSQPRWHSIRSPKLWQINHSSKLIKNQLFDERNSRGRYHLLDVFEIATDYRPRNAWLGPRAAEADPGRVLSDDGCVEKEEDEIEEC